MRRSKFSHNIILISKNTKIKKKFTPEGIYSTVVYGTVQWLIFCTYNFVLFIIGCLYISKKSLKQPTVAYTSIVPLFLHYLVVFGGERSNKIYKNILVLKLAYFLNATLKIFQRLNIDRYLLLHQAIPTSL